MSAGMREILVGICDDSREELDRIEDAMQKALARLGSPARISCKRFLDGEALYAASRGETFHLLFLDIEMPGLDGFGLAARLCLDRPQTRLVFVSMHESLVYDAPEYMPLWFGRKSRLERDMYRALRQYFRVTASTGITYRLKEGFGFREVPVRDILYVECSGHRITICRTDGGRLEKYGSLKAMEEELAGCHFLRIHKNYLVNQEYIKEVGKREYHPYCLCISGPGGKPPGLPYGRHPVGFGCPDQHIRRVRSHGDLHGRRAG